MVPIKINRKSVPGRYSVEEIFDGIEDSPGMKSFISSKKDRRKFLEETYVMVVDEDTYMWTDDEDGHINVGLEYLMDGEEIYLYLDILHEFMHVRQWKEGKELFDRSVKYIDRLTEVEAYDFVVHEARRLGLSDEDIYEYLDVEWITKAQQDRLAQRLGLKVAGRKRRKGG